MIAAWCVLFHRQGYTPSELFAATAWVAANDPPRWKTEHLAALVGRLRVVRAEARRLEIQQAQDAERARRLTDPAFRLGPMFGKREKGNP